MPDTKTTSADSDQIAKARAFWDIWVNGSDGGESLFLNTDPSRTVFSFAAAFAASERQAVIEDCCRAVCDRCRIDGPPRDCIGESTATPAGDDGGPRFIHLYANGDKLECDAEDIRSME